MLDLFAAILLLSIWFILERVEARGVSRQETVRRRPARSEEMVAMVRSRKKPEWVRREVIRLKALMPEASCRKLADTFCLLYEQARAMTVGKSYVHGVVRDHAVEILRKRREIRRRKPRISARNRIWGVDLTFIADRRPILGVVDHGTRACVALQELRTKGSIAILRALFEAIERFGLPQTIRTDNEVVFCSRLVRWSLAILGIRHQRIERCAPWQNGRVERFFGTFKRAWRSLREVDDRATGQSELDAFRAWYNHVRPHQHLEGMTPAMAWSGRRTSRRSRARWSEAWGGILRGYWIKP